MVAVALLDTATVLTVNVAVVAPAATVTEAGTVALALLLLKVTTRPPVGAALLTVTVPVEGFPPTTEVGLRTSDEAVGAVIVRFAVADWPFAEAVIVAVALAATGVVETVNVALVPPEATVTEAGTVAETLLLERLTTNPPAAAGLDRVTVPVLEEPPTTEVGLRTSVEIAGAVMVRVAVLATELQVAVIVELVVEATAVVVIVKVAVVAPATTVTDAGRVADDELLLRVTVRPPVGAALLMVTVPVDEFPPTTEVGLKTSEEAVGAVIVSVAV